MAVSFENSNTKNNLMKAFAGESQARNRYTFAASQAKKDNLDLISRVFIFTANQEKEHAELFYGRLQPIFGKSITIEGDYPVDIYNNTLDLLKCARNNEYEEYNNVYKHFGDEAKSEGFEDIATLFYSVAEIEKIHGDRYGKFINLIENGMLSASEIETQWFCLNCGHLHSSKEAPKECPVCSHNRGYFIKANGMPIFPVV